MKTFSIKKRLLQALCMIFVFLCFFADGRAELPKPFRALQADLDLVYDEDQAQQARNLDSFIARIAALSPRAVFLQAYSDDLGDGNVRSVYFQNKVLPMKADLFRKACLRIQRQGIMVFAWMPTMAIVLSDDYSNERLRVFEATKDGVVQPSTSWYANRLSPFSKEASGLLKELYAALASSAPIDGVIFQDDCYLNDFEDFNPEAVAAAKAQGITLNPAAKGQKASDMKRWTAMKTARLNSLTADLANEVRQIRPDAVFARTIYAPVVTSPQSEEWFAQNYKSCLKLYDLTVIMAYPRMEKVKNDTIWLSQLVAKAKLRDPTLSKTVFKLQAYDWSASSWISSSVFKRWVAALKVSGAKNMAYYPDDYTVDKPAAKEIKPLLFDGIAKPKAK